MPSSSEGAPLRAKARIFQALIGTAKEAAEKVFPALPSRRSG
jgi:hypothetical protein